MNDKLTAGPVIAVMAAPICAVHILGPRVSGIDRRRRDGMAWRSQSCRGRRSGSHGWHSRLDERLGRCRRSPSRLYLPTNG